MTSSEVFTSLFWMVATAYLIYLGWTIQQFIAYRTARRRHPTAQPPKSVALRSPPQSARTPTED